MNHWHVSSHDQQGVSDTALFVCHAVSSTMSRPMTNRQWVTQLAKESYQSCLIPWPTGCEWHTLLYSFARQSHQSCLTFWPTGSVWHCCIPLAGSLMNHVSFSDQQGVSDTAVFHWQAVSWIISHPLTNGEWVILLYLFQYQKPHQSCLIPLPTVGEWHCLISVCPPLHHPMTNRL